MKTTRSDAEPVGHADLTVVARADLADHDDRTRVIEAREGEQGGEFVARRDDGCDNAGPLASVATATAMAAPRNAIEVRMFGGSVLPRYHDDEPATAFVTIDISL